MDEEEETNQDSGDDEDGNHNNTTTNGDESQDLNESDLVRKKSKKVEGENTVSENNYNDSFKNKSKELDVEADENSDFDDEENSREDMMTSQEKGSNQGTPKKLFPNLKGNEFTRDAADEINGKHSTGDNSDES